MMQLQCKPLMMLIQNKKTLTCNHCKKLGHTKAQCYRMNGFPSTFKFTKGKRDEPRSTAQNVIMNLMSSIAASSSFPIIVEQYNQLMQMFNNHNLHSPTTSPSSITNSEMNSKGKFNFKHFTSNVYRSSQHLHEYF